MPTPEIDVRYVADLARLKLSDDEVNRFQKQLGDVLTYITQLQKVDVSGVDALKSTEPLTNNLRADVPNPATCLPIEAVMKNAPAHENDLIIVPKMVE